MGIALKEAIKARVIKNMEIVKRMKSKMESLMMATFIYHVEGLIGIYQALPYDVEKLMLRQVNGNT